MPSDVPTTRTSPSASTAMHWTRPPACSVPILASFSLDQISTAAEARSLVVSADLVYVASRAAVAIDPTRP